MAGDQLGFPLEGPVIEFPEAGYHQMADVDVHGADREIMVCDADIGSAMANKVVRIRIDEY